MMNKEFNKAIELRRSHYALDKNVAISDRNIQELIEYAVKHTPSAFNSQSARVIILLDEAHDKLWEITRASLKKIVPEAQFGATSEKMDNFKSAYGTVLFYEDQTIIEGLQSQFSLYKDNFPVWSEQSNGMLQYVIWTSLSNEGLGASLQHYNEVISNEVASTFGISEKWKLIAQMPFGNPLSKPSDKQVVPIEQRVQTIKK